jgi:putative tryptophan/tyrosine transport system substrate-binding protein
MRRREFMATLWATAAWSFAARAQQQPERIRRVGVLTTLSESDPEGQALLAVFRQRMRELGWVEGRNILLDDRRTLGKPDRALVLAAELVGTKPDVILVSGGTALSALMQETRSVPIVFVAAADPVELGYVASLSRPDGNATGFTAFERVIGPKWLEILKEIAPSVTRVLLLNPNNPASVLLLPIIKATAPSIGLQVVVTEVHDASEIEQAIDAYGREPNVGLLVAGSSLATVHRDLIIALAARNRLPAAYPDSVFPRSGGLFSYAIDRKDDYRNAASYVHRILLGEKPGDLPVQTPTKFELVINLKTAKALGLTVPLSLRGRADEVIE